MYNPLVDNLEDYSDSEIEKTVSDLSRKYWMTHNPQVKEQISTVLEMYKQELRLRISKQSNQNQENDDNSLDNLINIS
jgi:L-arabinose isomerase